MSHFAKINENNVVEDVIVIPDGETARGQEFINVDLGVPGVWIQTSYTGFIRKNYAGIGMTYDEARDAFIGIRCHESAVLDEETCKWLCSNSEHNYNLVNGEE